MIINQPDIDDTYSKDIISAPYDDDPSLWEKVVSLRNNGEIVIFNGELGSEEANYSLLKKNGKWEKNKI